MAVVAVESSSAVVASVEAVVVEAVSVEAVAGVSVASSLLDVFAPPDLDVAA